MAVLGHGNWLHLKLFRINSVWTAIRAALGWPSLILGLYMAAALLGSLIPANAEWEEPDTGISIFVETNGVHVSLIIPISAAGSDMSDLVRPQDLQDPEYFGTDIMIGWGHGGVYRHSPTWSDVRMRDIASAIVGSDDTLLHIYHVTDPRPAPYRRQFRVSAAQYRVIVDQIRRSFRTNSKGHSMASAGYGPDNLFYAANGKYSAMHTCNNWTGDVLRRAGVKMGIWTPMPGGVMRWFPARD